MRILSLAPLAGPAVDALRALGELELDPWSEHVPFKLHSAGELIARLKGIDALIVEADLISAEVLDGSALKYLGVCRGDPNNVDVAAATRNGVTVVSTPGRNAAAVADLTIGLMFGLLRHIVAADADVRAGRWIVEGVLPQQRLAGRELSSCTIGLIGFGAVGREVAARAIALGARVGAYDPLTQPASMEEAGIDPLTLEEVLERSDIVSIHAPLNQQTRGMLGPKEFAAMKRGALFVNTARYGIADEQALLGALRDGRLAGAALDHFENEFLPLEHPLIAMPNVILTPHIGGTTTETIENHTTQIARAFTSLAAGERPANIVNPETL